MSEILVYLNRMASVRHIPFSGTFELTPMCNLSCRMCYIRRDHAELLTKERWLGLAEEAREAGTGKLLLTGGEPLSVPYFLELYEALHAMGFLISVNTNGTLVNEDLCRILAEKPPYSVNVTLYGASAETCGRLCGHPEAYEKTVRGIRRLKAAGVRVILNTTFTSINIGDMDEILAFAKENGIPARMSAWLFPSLYDDIALSPQALGAYSARFEKLAKSKEEWAGFLEAMPEESRVSSSGHCHAGRSSFWITYDGKMRACGMAGEPVSLKDRSFAEAWNTLPDPGSLPEECLSCSFRRYCLVCPAVQDRTALCKRTKAYIETLSDQT